MVFFFSNSKEALIYYQKLSGCPAYLFGIHKDGNTKINYKSRKLSY